MECKRVMELMTQFINDQLEAEDVQAFLDHIDSCPECREELEVNYSLMTAMKQLDEDTDLSDNYIEELNQKIETCGRSTFISITKRNCKKGSKERRGPKVLSYDYGRGSNRAG